MQKLWLLATNNQTFSLSLDLSQLVAIYPNLATQVIRMQIKTFATDATPLLEFATASGTAPVVYTPGAQVAQFQCAQSTVSSFFGLKYFDIRVEFTGLGEAIIAYGEIQFATGVTLSSSSTQNSALSSLLGDTVLVINAATVAQPAIPPVSAATIVALAGQAAASAASANASSTNAAASAAAALADYNLTVSAGAAAVASTNAAASAGVASVNAASAAAVTNIGAAATTAVAAVAAAAATYTSFNQTAFLAWLNGLPTTLPAGAGQWWVNGGQLSQS